jgi:hypothetical protein
MNMEKKNYTIILSHLFKIVKYVFGKTIIFIIILHQKVNQND